MATQAGKVARFTDVDIDFTGAAAAAAFGFKLDGYDDGTSISGAPQGDKNTVREGNDGIPVFAERQTSWIIWTLVFLESSDSMDAFDAWLAAGVTLSMTVRDRGGRTVLSGLCRVRQRPVWTKSGGVEARTVDVHMVSTTGKMGGLNDPT